MNSFELVITEAEKSWCKTFIRWTIAQHLNLDVGPQPLIESATLQQELGAFVTLKSDGQLRGCIGNIIGQGPLINTLERMAVAAAFEDPRFTPLTASEMDEIQIEVSIMGPLTLCPDPERIEIGRHGLYIRKTMHSGLLLPQVAVEWGWDRETFLDQTCIKAGLPRGSWRKPKIEIWWFEAIIF